MARNSVYTRRTANFLLLARVKAKTRAAYSKAVKAFCAFLELRGVQLSLFDASAATLDRHLLRFVEYVFAIDKNHGKKRQLATNAMYGVILIRPDRASRQKTSFRLRARAVLQGWQTAFPSKNRSTPRFRSMCCSRWHTTCTMFCLYLEWQLLCFWLGMGM